jgi:hypothetical protein
MLNNREESRGARIEKAIAEAEGKMIIYQED